MPYPITTAFPPRDYAIFFLRRESHSFSPFFRSLQEQCRLISSNDYSYITECFHSILNQEGSQSAVIYRAIDLYVFPHSLITDPKPFLLDQKALSLIDLVADINKMVHLSSFSSQWKRFQKQHLLPAHCISIILYVIKLLYENNLSTTSFSRFRILHNLIAFSAKKAKIAFLEKICRSSHLDWDLPKNRMLTFFSTGIMAHSHQIHFAKEAFDLLPSPVQERLTTHFDPLYPKRKCKHFVNLCNRLNITIYSNRDIFFIAFLIIDKKIGRFFSSNLNVLTKKYSSDQLLLIARSHYAKHLQITASSPIHYLTEHFTYVEDDD